MLLHTEVHNISNVSTVQLCNLINSSKVDAGVFCTPLRLQQIFLMVKVSNKLATMSGEQGRKITFSV